MVRAAVVTIWTTVSDLVKNWRVNTRIKYILTAVVLLVRIMTPTATTEIVYNLQYYKVVRIPTYIYGGSISYFFFLRRKASKRIEELCTSSLRNCANLEELADKKKKCLLYTYITLNNMLYLYRETKGKKKSKHGDKPHDREETAYLY